MHKLIWQYRDDNNCWDYVRFWLNKKFNIPLEELPKFGPVIDATIDERYGMTAKKMEAMTSNAPTVLKFCEQVNTPSEGAIACKYYDEYLYHVGLVMDGNIYHVAATTCGVKINTPEEFQRGGSTRYYAHRSL